METKKITVDKEFSDSELQAAEYDGFEFAGQVRGRTSFSTIYGNKAIRKYWKNLLSSINRDNIKMEVSK